MLLDLIRQQGTPREALSYDAVMCAVEKWGLGWRVRSLLRMAHEEKERSRFSLQLPQDPIVDCAKAYIAGDTSWFEPPQDQSQVDGAHSSTNNT
mmetsp:Transcript_9333/g.27258  ORF Transcript_9333/g.27258 Transcript_9333/m.27258 type:complete len:94 (-) Transcript_9333:543-824(-)